MKNLLVFCALLLCTSTFGMKQKYNLNHAKYIYVDTSRVPLVLAKACKDNRCGFINMDASVAIGFDFYDTGEFIEGITWATDVSTLLNGLINTQGLWLVEPKYQVLDYAGYGLYLAQDIEGKFGYITTSGTVQIPFEYYSVGKFTAGVAQVYNSQKEQYEYINLKGEKVLELPKGIMPLYFGIDGLYYNRARVRIVLSTEDNVAGTGFYGFLDQNGKVAIPFEYAVETLHDQAKLYYGKYASSTEFTQGYAIVGKPTFVANQKKYIWKLIDTTGAEITFAQNLKLHAPLITNGCVLVSNSKGVGLAKANGDLIVEPKYADIQPFVLGKAKVIERRGDDLYCAYVDSVGKWLSEFMPCAGVLDMVDLNDYNEEMFNVKGFSYIGHRHNVYRADNNLGKLDTIQLSARDFKTIFYSAETKQWEPLLPVNEEVKITNNKSNEFDLPKDANIDNIDYAGTFERDFLNKILHRAFIITPKYDKKNNAKQQSKLVVSVLYKESFLVDNEAFNTKVKDMFYNKMIATAIDSNVVNLVTYKLPIWGVKGLYSSLVPQVDYPLTYESDEDIVKALYHKYYPKANMPWVENVFFKNKGSETLYQGQQGVLYEDDKTLVLYFYAATPQAYAYDINAVNLILNLNRQKRLNN